MSEPDNTLNNPFMLFQKEGKPEGGMRANVFIGGMIGPAYFYMDLMHFLLDATEEDEVIITIDNVGGILATGLVIGHLMDITKAKVHTKGMSIAASAAAHVFSKGHTRELSLFGNAMFHTASYGNYGKTNEHAAQQKYSEQLIGNIMDELISKNLVTPQDKNDILVKGKDVFISSTAFAKRQMAKEVG